MSEENGENQETKKMLFVMRKAPHGSIYVYEGLEVILIMGAYEFDISVLFMDDGVFAVKDNQDTTELGIKEFSKTFRALSGYDIDKLYVDKESLESRGMTQDDLIVETELLGADEIAKMMEEQDVLLPF